MRLMVTGSRDWNDAEAIRDVFRKITAKEVVLIHGDCEGADRLAAVIAEREFGWRVIPYKAKWEEYGRSAGPIRNKKMVASKPDLVLAFPTCDAGTKGSGTWDAIKHARNAGIPVEIHQ